MGFFDRLAAKKAADSENVTAQLTPALTASVPQSTTSVRTQLTTAREKLEEKDLPAALAIYDELLRTAGDRADVLVTLSGDLGSCGYLEQIVELVAPRYDAELHGPATGINLLQAYLATRHIEPAQHLLHILFGLNKPELEKRLHGFSNALAELIQARQRGELAPPGVASELGQAPRPANVNYQVELVSISKPIWSYGIDAMPGVLPPKSDRVRRIAFTQVALPNISEVNEKMKLPEDALGRFTRGFPLMLADCFHASPTYAPIAVLGTVNKEHYVIFGAEWTTDNLDQLVKTNKSAIDYVFTSTLQTKDSQTELVVKVWEIKKMKERKAFVARWTAEMADAELTKLLEAIRMFMEWGPYPAGNGLGYSFPTQPYAWCESLGTSLSFFLADKGILPKAQLSEPERALEQLAARAAQSDRDSLTLLTALDRATRLEVPLPNLEAQPLFASPLVQEAGAFLNL